MICTGAPFMSMASMPKVRRVLKKSTVVETSVPSIRSLVSHEMTACNPKPRMATPSASTSKPRDWYTPYTFWGTLDEVSTWVPARSRCRSRCQI